MTDLYADKRWQVGSNGAGKRHWFVWRHGRSYVLDGIPRYEGQRVALDKRGRTRWFGSRDAALRAATDLNDIQRSN